MLRGLRIGSILQDFRYAARVLGKKPGFTAIAVVTLALGIGLPTTMFSIVYGALLRGLPFEDASQIIRLRCEARQWIGDLDDNAHPRRPDGDGGSHPSA